MKIIILAGGVGSRLFPLSREEYPKQFLKITSNISLLIENIKRFATIVRSDDIVIVTSKRYELLVKEELYYNNIQNVHIILEPEGRNTAPAICLAVKYCEEQLKCSEKENIFVTPSDHVIVPADTFIDQVVKSSELTHKNKIVVFGVKPTAAETGYGYIKTGERYYCGFTVDEFKEKPNELTAKKYVQAGNYFWNSGMFTCTLGIFNEQMKIHAPNIFQLKSQFIYKDLLANFDCMTSISIDYALLECSSEVAMIELECKWNDIGSWNSIYEIMPKDKNNNAIVGNVINVESNNSMFFGGKSIVAGLGLSDILVVETDDVVLVIQKDKAQLVKQLVEKLKELKRPEVKNTNVTRRPWGKYIVHTVGLSYKIKTIFVNPNASLSLQMHNRRSEHWIVIKGTAHVTIDNKEQIISKNQSIFVPNKVKHRIENRQSVPLEIVEVQSGDYLGEDDIIRFDDVYGRYDDN